MNYPQLVEKICEASLIWPVTQKEGEKILNEVMTVIDTYLEQKAVEVEAIIVDSEGLTKFPIGGMELHTTIGGNAGSRRAAAIIRSKE